MEYESSLWAKSRISYSNKKNNMRYLISGGGTGGHIFPAVSIANALKEQDPQAEILFVGAESRMEMERVPAAGYKIIGLPVRGFNRAQPWKNISVVWDLLRSMLKARKIVKEFRPDAGVGVGGYASGAAMKVAAKMGVPIILQEQNGFAGVTNKLLKDDARLICVAYEGMERFFPKDKILLTGNPVRQNLVSIDKQTAINAINEQFGSHLTPDQPTLLIIGGSLGARTINEAVGAGIRSLIDAGIQVIWQTGKTYYEKCRQLSETVQSDRLICTAFVSDMPSAYAAADVVISRAGASSISELCLLGKASILVPSPNVAEDHQTHNAMALVRKDAAILVRDADAADKLVAEVLNLIGDKALIEKLKKNVLSLAQTDSAQRIAKEVIRIASENH